MVFKDSRDTEAESTMLSADLKDSVAFEIGCAVPQVQAVYTHFENDRTLHVWSVVPEHDSAIFRSIYAKEKQIISQFEGVDFDFNVVTSRGRDPKTLISHSGTHLVFVRE